MRQGQVRLDGFTCSGSIVGYLTVHAIDQFLGVMLVRVHGLWIVIFTVLVVVIVVMIVIVVGALTIVETVASTKSAVITVMKSMFQTTAKTATVRAEVVIVSVGQCVTGTGLRTIQAVATTVTVTNAMASVTMR